MLFSGILNDADQNIPALLNAENAGVQTDVIVLCLTPGTAGVVMVVHTAALVLFCKAGFGTLFRFTVKSHNAVSAVGGIGENVGMKRIGTVLQNIVRVSADNDTGTLIGQLQDHTALNIPQKIRGGKSVHDAGYTLRGKGIGEQASAGRMLAMLFYKFGCKTGFQSDLFNQPEPNSRLMVMIFFSMEIPPFNYIIVIMLMNVNKEDGPFGEYAVSETVTAVCGCRICA